MLSRVELRYLTAWSGNGWGYDRGRNLSISDDVTWTKGSHTFKAGFFFTKDDWWGGGQHRPNGSFNFGQGATSFPGDSSGNTGNRICELPARTGRHVGTGNAARGDPTL